MTNEPREVPIVSDKRVPPSGSLPKNTQPLVYAGIALVMLLIIWISGHSAPNAHTPTAPTPEPAAQPASQDRLNEYRKQIEDAKQKLAQEQNTLTQQKSLLESAVGQNAGAIAPGSPNYGSGPSPQAVSASGASNAIAEEKAKRDYNSRFASNLALSYRADPAPTSVGARGQSAPTAQASVPLDPRLYPFPLMLPTGAAAQTPQTLADSPEQTTKPTEPAAQRPSSASSDLNHASGKGYHLFEGTILETVLTNRLDGSFAGPVDCMVSEDVYSHDHNHVLIPSGSRVLGDVHAVESSGQSRLAVTFHRLIMPDGYSLSLDQFRGLDQVGETGLRDQVNHHYFQIFGASIAIGLVAGLAESNTEYGTNVPAVDQYRQGVASSLAQSSTHILDRFLNILPTFTIREGQRVKVYLQQDLALPAYENHEMSPDI